MSRGPSYTTRPVIIPSTSNIRTNHPSPRPPTINDFEAESSDENLPGGTISASAANEIVQETDEDKTDTMTVNADAASESEVQQFEILEDSELESGSVPLRDTVVRTSEDIEEIQVNALAGGLDDEDMDGFEIVSPVQTTKGLKIVKEAKDRGGNQYPLDSVKGKGRAIAVAAPGEPSENLLASFGELSRLLME
ncbi:hypothetical protein QFC19_006798 [Naganishia cerealis]|uniref:Uncharacterized protein n=1 Tax=Naganishia cerealis TaxID=610337 RepID=A0ACC2VED6_9TREE|nr:hypothetical protein QFC19_006798 [Naganishia cerealis]